MSDPSRAPFFFPGGTLPPDAPSYIAREADEELYQSLRRGEFCYILTSRQMGKSSLIARTAVRLRESGITVAIIDLNAIGHDANLTPEQWYFSLLMQIGEQLDCEQELEAFWQDCNRPTPLQKWTAALRHLLPSPPFPLSHAAGEGENQALSSNLSHHAIGNEELAVERTSFQPRPPSPLVGEGAGVRGNLVIFIDEIDQVRALPFSTDEFFAAIRNTYNRRSIDPAFARLTFCLLGVALPSDLIRDPRLTPFNIGRRIELNDFTSEEALALEPGLGREEIVGEALLERVTSWTGGHPYLTQRLCQAIVEAPEAGTPQQVDELCDRLFLSSGAQEQDDNLVFVRDRLLRSLDDERDVASLLTLYDRIVAGKRVEDRKSDTLVGVLRLSGIVRPVNSLLQVRNRIYERVFDRRWIREHMPGAELRRQRAAYFLGLLRAVAVSLVLLTCIGSLTLFAFYQARIARTQTHLAKQQADRANQERMRADQARNETERLLYAADMNVAQQAYEKGEYGRLARLLEAHRPKPGDKEDLRGFEWRYFWRLMHRDVHTFIHPGKGIVFSVAFSPDGKTLASANGDGTIMLWDMVRWREKATLHGPAAGIFSLAFSPNGKWLAAGCLVNTVEIWDITTQRMVKPLKGYSDKADTIDIAFSPDGQWLASGDESGTIILWSLTTWHAVTMPKAHKHNINSIVFSPDGRWMASDCQGEIKLWEAPFRQATITLPASNPWPLAFSPDSKTLAMGMDAGSQEGQVELWNIRTRHKIATLQGHKATVNGIAFSPKGRYLATGSWDNTIRLWDVAARKTVHTFIGHNNRVTSVAFSPDGRWLASGGSDEIKVWDPMIREENPHRLDAFPTGLDLIGSGRPLTFSHNGSLPQIAYNPINHAVMLLDYAERRARTLCYAPSIESAAFAPDDKTLAIGTQDGKVVLLDITSGRKKSIQVNRRLVPHPSVGAVAFSSNGRMLAAASGDPALVTLWDISSGREIAHFTHSNQSGGIAFSPDGKILAAANWQGRVYLWDIATGEQTVWWAQAKPVQDVAFSPDGKTLATASGDTTVKLWNVATQREMITLKDPKGSFNSVAFSLDGDRLAALCWKDKKVWVWKAASLAEVDRAR